MQRNAKVSTRLNLEHLHRTQIQPKIVQFPVSSEKYRVTFW